MKGGRQEEVLTIQALGILIAILLVAGFRKAGRVSAGIDAVVHIIVANIVVLVSLE